jgi:hypothetical protein
MKEVHNMICEINKEMAKLRSEGQSVPGLGNARGTNTTGMTNNGALSVTGENTGRSSKSDNPNHQCWQRGREPSEKENGVNSTHEKDPETGGNENPNKRLRTLAS